MKNLTVSMSINTLDENFKNDMDNASSISDRLETLKELHNNGIKTVLFMSPIFPYITDFKKIIDISKDYIDEYWFENLNLRGSYKQTILSILYNSVMHKTCCIKSQLNIFKNLELYVFSHIVF